MKMKRTILTLIAAVLALMPASAQYPVSQKWADSKYSMFIHFGLYSELGGVWQGKEIRRGYSEQIQSHAGIRSDEYEEVADVFDPRYFDADAIVSLAREAGMRSIVITSKHHDGFCMFRTETTDFNSYDLTPSHRDFIEELSSACHRAGMGFGLYFSLIDWHYPGGNSITTHNANFIAPGHHDLNMRQVTELVTKYGEISELWFDMGSLSPEQSKDLYELVHKYQPQCMVSGRLGNGYYDFAVMGDNYYPESSLQTPWQTCASMFNATWGYRSWQERGNPHDKAQEKLRSLIHVVSGGGNYLLNIGPMGDGSVVPWEAAVLREMGSWLEKNANAIYATEPSPFRTPFTWGCITRRANIMYLILSGKQPDGNEIVLPMKDYKIMSVEGPASAKIRKGMLNVKLYAGAYQDDIRVVRIVFDKTVLPDETKIVNEKVPVNSYHCQDYYTNFRSIPSYTWNTYSKKKLAGVCFTYTETDVDKDVEVCVDGHYYNYRLHKQGGKSVRLGPVTEGQKYVCRTSKMTFDDAQYRQFTTAKSPGGEMLSPWSQVSVNHQIVEAKPFQTVFVMENVRSSCDQEVIMEVGAGNGVELYVNGVSVMKHLNPYRCTHRVEKVRVRLHEGDNQVVLRAYNRFERNIEWTLKVSDDQQIYRSPLYLPEFGQSHSHTISVRQAGTDSFHKDCELYNLQMIF